VRLGKASGEPGRSAKIGTGFVATEYRCAVIWVFPRESGTLVTLRATRRRRRIWGTACSNIHYYIVPDANMRSRAQLRK